MFRSSDMTNDLRQGVLIVKVPFQSTMVLSCLLAIVSSGAVPAQQQGPVRQPREAGQAGPRSVPRGPVAVVDISLIFKNHQGFKQSMDGLKAKVDAAESGLRARHEALAKERDKLAQYKTGSPNYKALEQQIADGAAKIQVDMQLQKKEFLEEEARVYFDTYRQIQEVIADYANKNNIGLVLRFSRDPIEREDRQSVLAGVNRAIVYESGLDITNDILSNLDRAAPRMSNSNARPANSGRSR
jgi:Skp family chaperone for outer membrane proteins